MPLLIGAVSMLLLTVIFWPVKAILRWRYGSPFPLTGRAAALYRGTHLVALIDLLFLGGYAGVLTYGGGHLEVFDTAYDPLFLALQILGVIGIVGTVVPFYELRLSLFDHARPWWTKLTDGLNALACLSVVWFAFTLNLVNFHLNY